MSRSRIDIGGPRRFRAPHSRPRWSSAGTAACIWLLAWIAGCELPIERRAVPRYGDPFSPWPAPPYEPPRLQKSVDWEALLYLVALAAGAELERLQNR